MYESQFREEMNIIRQAKQVCEIVSASYNAHYYYPTKLRKVGKGWPALDKSCFNLILDSNIGDETVTNKDILQEAQETQATKIIPKDYIDEPERTLESLREFENIVEDKNIDLKADVVPILQDPHIAHLEEHLSFYESYKHIAIGGIKGNRFTTEEKIQIFKQVRNLLGDKVHIHGFGMGCSLDIIKAIRENPNLLDSFDMATAETMVMNGKVTDWTFTQQEPTPPLPYGENKSTVNAGFSKSVLIMLNYMLTDKVNEEKLEEMFIEELGLDKVQKIIKEATDEELNEPINLNHINQAPDSMKENPIEENQEKISSF